MNAHRNLQHRLGGLAACLLAATAQAQTSTPPPVDAGRVLEMQTQRPSPPRVDPSPPVDRPIDAGPQESDRELIRVTGIRFSGDTSIVERTAASEALAALGPLPRDITLGQLRALARQVTGVLRESGYFLARAYLPAQDIRDGQVELAVVQGRIGQVLLDNRSATNQAVLDRLLEPVATGDGSHYPVMSRSLMLLRELPGVVVQGALRPGTAAGTSDLLVAVEDGPRLLGEASIDNFGNPYTGRARASLSAQYANAAGWGDLLGLQASKSVGTASARLSWQVPVGSQGVRLGAMLSDVRYRLGDLYQDLGAHGNAAVQGLSATYPLLRRQQASVDAQFIVQSRQFDDRIDAQSVSTTKRSLLAQWVLTGSLADDLGGGGLTQFSLALNAGRLRMDADSLAADQSPQGLGTAGRFQRWALSLSRVQRLHPSVSLQASFAAQGASKNLGSADKMSLGGPQGVRAYPSGEAAGDDAALLSVNLNVRLPAWPRLEWTVLYDRGRSWSSHTGSAASPVAMRDLHGFGAGLRWSIGDGFALSATAARRTGEPARSEDVSAWRAWVEVSKAF